MHDGRNLSTAQVGGWNGMGMQSRLQDSGRSICTAFILAHEDAVCQQPSGCAASVAINPRGLAPWVLGSRLLQDEIAEAKRKFKITSHQINQLKEEVSAKDLALVKEHFEHIKVGARHCDPQSPGAHDTKLHNTRGPQVSQL